MTGAYPHVNGVRDNGSFRFDGKLPTLAGTLKGAGYRTGAFVASFVLDASFGLNAGFDVYDDRYGSRPAGGDLTIVERPPDAVLDAAVPWITAARTRGQPWFAWVHLYDPHEPYDPPEPFRSRFSDGPVRRRDRVCRRPARRRARRAVAPRPAGQHPGRRRRGSWRIARRAPGANARAVRLRRDAARAARRCGRRPAFEPGVLRGPAQLVDVMPTVLDLVGVTADVPNGRSLWPFARDGRAGRRRRRVFRGAQREPDAALGAADGPRVTAASSSSTCRSRSCTIWPPTRASTTNLFASSAGRRSVARQAACRRCAPRRPRPTRRRSIATPSSGCDRSATSRRRAAARRRHGHRGRRSQDADRRCTTCSTTRWWR